MAAPRDTLYADPIAAVTDFVFDERVAAVFPDMIRRSVPGYGAILSAIGLLAERYAQPGSRCYDLGCSLGGAALAMRHGIRQADCRIIAADNSPAMLARCQAAIAQDEAAVPVDLVCCDIRDLAISDASLVVLNFTLQFLPTTDRLPLLQRICQGLRPGGALLISEKLAFTDPRQQALHIDMHHAFKRAQGYSDMEISQKRTALENVMIPETLEQHRARLAQAGFASCEPWFQYFNFASLIALK
jgi:tRNA (cmo5U34)-methyltransferase